MPNSTANDFAERMKYVAAQDFGGTYRPGLVAALANGSLSPDQITQVTNFVKALDLAKVAKANDAAGLGGSETSASDSDLLMSIGEDKSIVQRANSTVHAAGNQTAASDFIDNTFQTIAQYSANSGDIIFPQPKSFAPGNIAPDGSSNESIAQKAWHGILTGLSWLGRVPGFLYQGGVLSGNFGGVGSQAQVNAWLSLAQGMQANGNYKANAGDGIAYLWSHGESMFSDLGPVRSQYGDKLVNTAVAMFQADKGYGSASRTLTGNVDFENALANYQGFLNAQLQAGKITPKQYSDATKALSDPQLQDAYKEVDGRHISVGRDLTRDFGLDPANGAGHYTSGIADFAWDMFADPTIVGAKAKAGVTALKYGLDGLGDTSKLSKLYGVADRVTGEIPHLNPVLDAGAIQAQRRVSNFLAYNAAIRTAEADGDKALAAALYSENAARHPDLMPAYMEAQGWRAASTPEEIARARADGTSLSLGGDAVHEAMAPSRGGRSAEEIARNVAAFKDASIPAILNAKPLQSLDDWVDWLGNQGGLYRWASGLSLRQARVLPGKMGFAAEARAAMVGRRAFNRVLNGAERNPMIAALLNGTLHDLTEFDIDKEAGKIIPDDAGEAYKTAFAARAAAAQLAGRGPDGWLSFARSLKSKGDATIRRLTTWLPTNHIVALNSVQGSKDFERFVRTFMGKDVGGVARYLWDNAESESARRQIGRAIVNTVADTSGITRSPAGRAWMEQWNAAFDELENARYGLSDTDLIPDVYRGMRRVAMNLSQLETHLVLPAFTDMRRVAAKAAILGFDQPLDQIGSKFTTKLKSLIAGDTPMKGFLTTADGEKDVVAGMRRMLASPSMTIRYGLFNNYLLTRMFGLMKLGWLGTTSNMLRQFAEEYVGLRLTHHGADLAEGKRLLRASGNTSALIQKTHHLIPHFLRPSIMSEGDIYHAITRGRLSFSYGERPLDDMDHEIIGDLSDMLTQREVTELLGARQTTVAEGGVQDAMDAHQYDVLMQRVGWKRGQLKGYSEKEMADLNTDTGRRALAAMYVNMFIDKDEPARRVLAYLMWNQAAKSPKFLKSLDPETIKLMHDLVPVDDASLAAALKGQNRKIATPMTTAIKDYVREGEGAGPFRQRAEWLNRDESGRALAKDDLAGRDAAIERYVHSQVMNVASTVFARDGKSMNADLVSKLLKGRTPSEVDLADYSAKDLPEHVIAAEFAPAADGPLDKLGEKIAHAAAKGGKAFDHIVTNPMQRLERKPLFYGNYARNYRELQRYRDIMTEQGFSAEDAKGITRRMALGRALQDTLRYLDNPKVSSQLSSVASNFWLFYRAQEDFIRRWVGIVKERPETLRLAQMAINGAVQSGMIYRDSDGNLQLSYPGSGAVIDGFLMAQHALGFGDTTGIKVPSAHDLTTQLNYLNPSLMNPTGFQATPMVTIPFDLLKVAIPGHDMLKSQIDYAFHGQLGNGRSWWEQFMPTEINRIMQLQGENDNTGSQVGGAAATTILHASLAGQLSDKDSSVVAQEKITDLKTQTLGALWARALFAFAAPGATSLPELDYKDRQGNWMGDPNADISWRAMGVKNMSDEYKAMIQAFGVDKANLVWAEMHPNLLPYSVGKTTTGAASANADPTLGATQWVFDNKQLFEGPYKRVAAYFIPAAPGTFSQTGWNAMTEIGVRQYKSLEAYYLDIATKNAVSTWYAAKDKYDPIIAQARAAGQRTTELEAEYTNVKNQIKAEYPILTDYFNQHSSRQSERTQSISDLRQMVADPSVKLPELQGVAQMLTVLDNYNQQQAILKGQRSNWATTQRQSLNFDYEDAMAGIIKKFPGLNDLYNGVFREMEQ